MRSLIVFGLILSLLALNCEAMAPVQLTGTSGKDILTQIASTKITTQLTNASSAGAGLWSWGSVPYGNIVSDGKLVSTGDDGNTLLVYPAFPINDTPIYRLSDPMTSKYVASDLNDPDYNRDSWAMAQATNQPVLY
jgi:hypothetical protein